MQYNSWYDEQKEKVDASEILFSSLQLHGHNRSGLLALDYGLLTMPCNSLQNYVLMQSLILFFSLALAAPDDSNWGKY